MDGDNITIFAEAMPMKAALEMLITCGFKNLEFETNNKELIKMIMRSEILRSLKQMLE